MEILELKFSFVGNISSFLGVPFDGSKVEATGTDVIKIFGFKEEFGSLYPDENGEFHDAKICFLKDIEGYEEASNFLWYSYNNCNNIMSIDDIEDSIPFISWKMSGNIHFNR